MRRFALTLMLAGTAVILASSQPHSMLSITNVTVVSVEDGTRRVANVVVRDGVIADITEAAAPGGTTVIDGRGKFLIPGLWDMHVHLATRSEPALAEKMLLPAFLANGIVGVRDMGGPLERVLDLRAQVARGAVAGPRILAPGPFIDGPGADDPMFRRAADPAGAEAQVAELAAAGVDFIKAQAGLAPGVHTALARAARGRRIPLAGHIPLSMTAAEIIASGQRSIEHISPALVGDGLLLFACSSRAADLLEEFRAIESDRGKTAAAGIAQREAALRQQLIETYDPARAQSLGRSMRDQEVWIVPTLVWSAGLRPLSQKHDGRDMPMDLVPATLRTRWLEQRRQYIERQTADSFAAAAAVAAAAARAVRDLHQGGARVLAGTDSFDAFVLPGHSLHQELQLLVDAGLSPRDALQTATRNAAEYRGTSNTEGTIARGKRADLVLLDADPLIDIANTRRVSTTIVGGRVFTRDTLDALVAGIKVFSAK